MEQTIYDILTDESAREPGVVATSLAAEATQGAPWFDAMNESGAPQNG